MSKKFILAQIFFVFAFAAVLFFYWQRGKDSGLPVYGTVAGFQLQDQDGKNVTLAFFKGKVWVADFMFTTCGSLCPLMSRHMADLNQVFSAFNDVCFASISVNPENDTPFTLKTYARKYNADGRQWVFLTGPRPNIQELVVGSFKVGDIKDIVFHSPMFVLVDRKARIRGYYDSTDTGRLKQLEQDLPKLRRE